MPKIGPKPPPMEPPSTSQTRGAPKKEWKRPPRPEDSPVPVIGVFVRGGYDGKALKYDKNVIDSISVPEGNPKPLVKLLPAGADGKSIPELARQRKESQKDPNGALKGINHLFVFGSLTANDAQVKSKRSQDPADKDFNRVKQNPTNEKEELNKLEHTSRTEYEETLLEAALNDKANKASITGVCAGAWTVGKAIGSKVEVLTAQEREQFDWNDDKDNYNENPIKATPGTAFHGLAQKVNQGDTINNTATSFWAALGAKESKDGKLELEQAPPSNHSKGAPRNPNDHVVVSGVSTTKAGYKIPMVMEPKPGAKNNVQLYQYHPDADMEKVMSDPYYARPGHADSKTVEASRRTLKENLRDTQIRLDRDAVLAEIEQKVPKKE
ncbi:hypothetical protein [Cystobacter ferrugineus]|uniref:Uncharacterized protein n=1 Tax=Cystobacter ferrugineus TaxID=83449 RepID=A0A1L9BG57_9BACT|nr:hypothetical protein [Cystobacter ferrugineus]OJH41196.1 hypothetical protein BON30_09945 [Cystobacter ferrugineus]